MGGCGLAGILLVLPWKAVDYSASFRFASTLLLAQLSPIPPSPPPPNPKQPTPTHHVCRPQRRGPLGPTLVRVRDREGAFSLSSLRNEFSASPPRRWRAWQHHRRATDPLLSRSCNINPLTACICEISLRTVGVVRDAGLECGGQLGVLTLLSLSPSLSCQNIVYLTVNLRQSNFALLSRRTKTSDLS